MWGSLNSYIPTASSQCSFFNFFHLRGFGIGASILEILICRFRGAASTPLQVSATAAASVDDPETTCHAHSFGLGGFVLKVWI